MDDGLDPGPDVEGLEDAELGFVEDSLQEDGQLEDIPADGATDANASASGEAIAAVDAASADVNATALPEGKVQTSETDANCKRLLGRYEAVGHALAGLGHPHTPLLQAVELVEALLQDFKQRADVEVEAHNIAESQRRERQPHLIRQLTFYFSDANLRHDKFLRQKIEEDGAGLGFVEMALLLSFNRVKQIGCTTAVEIAAAVEAAPAASGLELSAQRDAIRRRGGAPLPPMTSIANAEAPSMKDQCTIRIERLPKNNSVDADAVSKLCASYGEVAHVWLVHTSKGEPEFTGVAEVQFRAKEAADAAVTAQPPLEWSGSPLLVKSLADFRAERSEHRGMKRSLSNDEGNDSAKRSRIEKEAVDSAARFNRGAVLRLDDVPAGVGWMDIKDAFVEYGEVVYVDTDAQSKSHKAYVRMRDAEGAAAAIKGLASSGGFIWFELPDEAEDKKSEEKKSATPAAGSEDKVAEDSAAPPISDPYGGEAEESAAVPKSDPYGGGDEAGGAADEKAAEAAEADPFVVDTEGSAVVDAKEDKPAEQDGKALDDVTEKTQTYRVAVVLLAGDEEEAYIQKMALALAEKRAKLRGKGGKDGKDGKDGKAGKREKGGKGGKGSKEGKGKGKKGGKDGKHKSGKRAKGDDSDSE